MEESITVTRSQLVAAFKRWVEEAEKTPDGEAYADAAVHPPRDYADTLIAYVKDLI